MLLVVPAHAMCPVCTIAIGGLLVFFESIGLKDLIIPGIWIGGLTLSFMFWTANYMNKKGVKNAFWYVLNFIVYYSLIAALYFVPATQPFVVWGERTLFGADQFLIGLIAGSVAFWIGAKWYSVIKRNNGGHAKFPFQKVVMPVAALLIATAAFAGILYL
jgi:hypothetical protein